MGKHRDQPVRERAEGAHLIVPAKIARPICRGVHDRMRVFRLMDRARSRPIVWLSSPAGAGKTTLAASYAQARQIPCLWYQMDAGDRDIASFFYYLKQAAAAIAPNRYSSLPILTSDHLPSLETFAANFFRELFAQLAAPAMLVLDNYQELADDRQIQCVLQTAFAQIPEGVNVVVLSREPAPGYFARERASERMSLLTWNEIKLTADESAAIARTKIGADDPACDIAADLHEQTQGWVAGLVLLTEQFNPHARDSARPAGAANQCIFDYFAHEVFRNRDPLAQTLLLQTAFLSKFSASLAVALTGSERTQQVLDSLAQRNLFTTLHADGRYEYHALFRTFLNARAHQQFTPEQIADLKRSSARLSAENGELIQAVDLLRELGDWPSLMELIRAHATSLTAQGRAQTLSRWLESIPSTIRAQDPWMLYWSGMCRLAWAPTQARADLESAYELFSRRNDISPLYRTWSRIIESFVLNRDDFESMDAWLDKYSVLQNGPTRPTAEVETESIFAYVAGLTNHRFDDPQLPIYVAKAEKLIEQQSDTDRQLMWSVNLIPYYLWKGLTLQMRRLLRSLANAASTPDARPLGRIYWHMWTGMAAGVAGEAQASLHAIENGLALAHDTGVHVLNISLYGYGIWGQLSAGNVAQARTLLDRMSQQPRNSQKGEAVYRHYHAMVLLHERQYALAVEENLWALDVAKNIGMYSAVVSFSLSLAFIYIAQGNLAAASGMLNEVRPKALAMQSKTFISYCLLCEADIHRIQGNRESALNTLRDALQLREEIGNVTAPFVPRENAASLYAMALDAKIFADYVLDTIAKTQLPPPKGELPEQWPWPIRIYALGHFTVWKEGSPLTGNARQKPMQFLRVLVANGGRDVSVATIANALWPDAEGDMAKRTVETTLHRLRSLIGETTIVRQGNRLSLDSQTCWLDLWAFDKLLADHSCAQIDGAPQVERLLEIYKGSLLATEEFPWAVQERRKYQAKFLRAIVERAEEFEREDAWQQAASAYRRALEVEPVAEDLYRRLMQCYRHLDCIADALVVYQRCRQVLASTLKVNPSAALTALHAEIVAART